MQQIALQIRRHRTPQTTRAVQELRAQLRKSGFTLTTHKPQLVISLGGDGTFLEAERRYPGVPKLLLKDSQVCHLCDEQLLDERVIEAIERDTLRIERYEKLTLKVHARSYDAANDVVVRNADQRYAIRFNLRGEGIDEHLIADGLVFATRHGSTGYYRSITRRSFTSGFAIAVNNPTIAHRPIRFDEGCFAVVIDRGEAILTVDNAPTRVRVRAGDRFSVASSGRFVELARLKR